MDLSNFYGTGILLKGVENIEEKIFSSSAYAFFDTDNSFLIQEYKKFEVTIISLALIAIFFEIDITNRENREQLRTIYLGKTAEFQRLILSKKIKIHDLDVSNMDKSRQEGMLNLKIGVKFEEYYSDIKESIKNESIYYFWEYDTPERKWDSVYMQYTDEIIKGEDKMYRYLWNLFLCYEGVDFENDEFEPCISYKMYKEMENTDLMLIDHFITEIIGFRN